ncbi:hypothetical protein V6D40_05715 [Corynebacterium sp. Q4381]|uniref:hypothetical protein n=1 Tax=Corynebacterium sp. Marseille-Q4381 TaxID=3121597 RepID=UPI002FE5F6B1
MSAPLIAEILNGRYGFDFAADRITEIGRTPASTLFEANNDEGAAVEIEVFDAPIAQDTTTLDEEFAKVQAPGAFRPRHAGLLDDGRVYILREASVGTPFSDLVAAKKQAGEQFTDAETRDLLSSVAQAVDDYNAAGHPEFLARSIAAKQLLVQPSWSDIPVKLALVGPSPESAAAEDNLHDFWNLVADVTGRPVDEEAAAKNATALGYLQDVCASAADNVTGPGSGLVAPGDHDGYRRPPEPYPAGYVPPAPEKEARNPWPWIIGALAIALIAMALAWYFTTQRGEEWSVAEKDIAAAYPEIVSRKSGQRGWQDLKCESAAPDAGQEAKIRCAGEELGVSVAKYPTEAQRDEELPGQQYATVLGSGECMIEDYEIPDAYPQAFAMAPRDKGQYLIVVNGYDAETVRLDLPVCE